MSNPEIDVKSLTTPSEESSSKEFLSSVQTLSDRINDKTTVDITREIAKDNSMSIVISNFHSGGGHVYLSFNLNEAIIKSKDSATKRLLIRVLNHILEEEEFQRNDIVKGTLEDAVIENLRQYGVEEDLIKKLIYATQFFHMHQVDKGGNDYIDHCYRVSLSGNSYSTAICGLMHDLLEDTNITVAQIEEYLSGSRYKDEIITALKLLDKTKDSKSYDDYIRSILKDPVASYVKYFDLKDNLDLTRLGDDAQLSELDFERCLKYVRCQKRIKTAYPFIKG